MKKTTKHVSVSVLSLFFIILAHSSSLYAQEVEDEQEFEYIEGSAKGPYRWGDLKKEWETCKNGNMQSPIDLSSKKVKINSNFQELKMSYKPSNAIVKNRGHDIMVKWVGGAGTVRINDTDYMLKQCHWHSPSEHIVNGKRYDLELHMVHSNTDVTNNVAVLGLFYTIGEPDFFLSKLATNIASISNSKAESSTGVIDPRDIKKRGNEYYSYIGSLTTPPCTEGVNWIIGVESMTVSKEQVQLLKDAVHDAAVMNARPIH